MASLEELKHGAQVKGILPGTTVTIIQVEWHGSDVAEVTYRDEGGKVGQELLFRDREADLQVVSAGTPWAFNSDGEAFRLVSEAYRIRMAYLFDPWMAVHLSMVEPLPHQISAVYEHMLPRQPLRFLLADDPGAGKTIMTGLFIKEMMLRGDLQRCLIVSPGNLTEQWQDELSQRFGLDFELLTNDRIAAARTGNALQEMRAPFGSLVIARLDKLSRDEELQEKLKASDWDLVVFDEAHKLSASVFAGEIKYTRRYNLGQLLAGRARHLLFLTATPHNGKEEDFQLFMALLDPDRFAGRYRDGVHSTDASDLMRRLVKEQLLKFDGKPLFPERRAYTAAYKLSPLEAALYEAVTTYVREEFNRAENLEKERKGTVGFALTILQRRLASSPEAIYRSLSRRRERLESKLREVSLLKRGAEARLDLAAPMAPIDEEGLDELEEAPEDEFNETAEQVLDQATAAQTIQELEAEIRKLQELEALADRVRRSDQDRKWSELSRLLQDNEEMFEKPSPPTPSPKMGEGVDLVFAPRSPLGGEGGRGVRGQRRKLVIFTEHRDTLNYLEGKIGALIGRAEAVVTIHGGLAREQRRAIQAAFVQDKDVLVLLATDAAGEGINLQRAHLMVNYDLPWNPNRLEQRFGRIHRIGQTEVCHLWNLVADETREGEVYARLLKKLERERETLGDSVFDVLGKLFQETSLRQLLIEAVRYGDRPEVKARLDQAVDNLADQKRVRELLEEYSLARDSMDTTKVRQIRQDFERAQALRLQPHFVEAFFMAAFERLGGTLYAREPLRCEITSVPAALRSRSLSTGKGPILRKYERVTFHKEAINLPGKPPAEFLSPGHPLMDAVIDVILERYRGLLRQGAILVDRADPGEEVRALFYLEHSIQDARTTALTPGPSPARGEGGGGRRVISRQMQFVEINGEAAAAPGETVNAGPAPFLDYEPLPEELRLRLWPALLPKLENDWLRADLEPKARAYAAQHIVPAHLKEVKARREETIARTLAAVHDRLTKEIAYWDHRAAELRQQEQAGKPNAGRSADRLNSDLARRRADDLQARLQRRLDELEAERHISPQPPVVIGGALVIPQGLIDALQGKTPDLFGRQRKAVEDAAMRAVIEQERISGCEVRDVSRLNLGWDVEAAAPATGKLRFIEVKGRIAGAETITVTKNEILAGLNKPEDYWLAVVEVRFEGGKALAGLPLYLQMPFRREPDFAATSVNYEMKELLRASI